MTVNDGRSVQNADCVRNAVISRSEVLVPALAKQAPERDENSIHAEAWILVSDALDASRVLCEATVWAGGYVSFEAVLTAEDECRRVTALGIDTAIDIYFSSDVAAE